MILSLDHWCASWKASAASLSFSKIVRCDWAWSAFLTNCCSIVEAPWTLPP